jgi:hypothetical protein
LAACRDLVTWRGIDVFGIPADDVARQIQSHTRVVVEDEGGSLTAPDLLLALWRPFLPEDADDPEGRYWRSALVAASGYYDGPAMAR